MSMPPLTEVDCSRGAPMGRMGQRGDPNSPYKVHLQKMRMVDGDYDQGGAYWGSGSWDTGWMYQAYSTFEDEYGQDEIEMFIRARGREDAKAKVLEEYPNATFFR